MMIQNVNKYSSNDLTKATSATNSVEVKKPKDI